MQEIVGVGGGGSREQLDGGFYFILVSRAFAPRHARNNSGTRARRAGGYVPLCDLEEDAYGAPPEITVAGVARGARYRALGRNAHNIVASRESELGLYSNLYLASVLNKCFDL